MERCERCNRAQPRILLVDVGEYDPAVRAPVQRLICLRCLGRQIELPEVVRDRELPPDDGTFGAEHVACDTCARAFQSRDLVGVRIYLDGELVPVAVCRYCAERAVYFPDPENGVLEARNAEVKAERRVRSTMARAVFDGHA